MTDFYANAFEDLADEPMECLEAGPNCRGKIDLWYSGGLNGRSWPRCTFHGERRLARYEDPNSLERWADSDMAPPWFDPSIAGERWDDDY